MQSKITIRYYLMPNRVAISKKEKKGDNEYLRGYREKEPHPLLVGM